MGLASNYYNKIQTMNILEANIEIMMENGKAVSVSVSMPVWGKKSEIDGNLHVKIPLLNIETIAKDENDADIAIKEAIQGFCIVAQKFGQGIEKELQSLGWTRVDHNGNPILGYCVSETDDLIDRLIQTGDSYINPKLELTEEPEYA